MDERCLDRARRTLAMSPRHPTTARFPILAFIDRALGDGQPRFADAADAPWLEQRARALTEQYWSDSVWTTGVVAEAAFRRVCDALERERLVATERETGSADVASAA